MATASQLSLETYLATSYEPDAEYVNGEIEERNVGEYDHNMVQQELVVWFRNHRQEWKIRVVQEQRTRMGRATVRIPDVSVFSRELPVEQVFTRPQLIAIEVLSPEDGHSRQDERIEDFINFGVKNIWVVDPQRRWGWDCSDGNWVRKRRFEAAGTPIYLDLDGLFAAIDAD